MATYTRNDALAAESYEAQQFGVPEELAHAIAYVESRHDPNAIGDQGTSFGDYQLHRGGLLGSLTPAQAFNPYTNARVALSHLADTRRKYPNVQDPGALAALSQGPADRQGYAVAVDQAMHTAPAGSTLAGSGQSNLAGFNVPGFGGSIWRWTEGAGGAVLHGVGNIGGDIGGAISAPFVAIYNLMHGIWKFFTNADTWIRVGLFVGGFVILIMGAKIAFGSSAVPVPVPV